MAQIYNIDESFDYSLFDNASCAFGVFDGVHKGHRYLFYSGNCTVSVGKYFL